MHDHLLRLLKQEKEEEFRFNEVECDFTNNTEDLSNVYIPSIKSSQPTRILTTVDIKVSENEVKPVQFLLDTGCDFEFAIPSQLIPILGSPKVLIDSKFCSYGADGSQIDGKYTTLQINMGGFSLITNVNVIDNLPTPIVGLGIINNFFDLFTSRNNVYLIPRRSVLSKIQISKS